MTQKKFIDKMSQAPSTARTEASLNKMKTKGVIKKSNKKCNSSFILSGLETISLKIRLKTDISPYHTEHKEVLNYINNKLVNSDDLSNILLREFNFVQKLDALGWNITNTTEDGVLHIEKQDSLKNIIKDYNELSRLMRSNIFQDFIYGKEGPLGSTDLMGVF